MELEWRWVCKLQVQRSRCAQVEASLILRIICNSRGKIKKDEISGRVYRNIGSVHFKLPDHGEPPLRSSAAFFPGV